MMVSQSSLLAVAQLLQSSKAFSAEEKGKLLEKIHSNEINDTKLIQLIEIFEREKKTLRRLIQEYQETNANIQHDTLLRIRTAHVHLDQLTHQADDIQTQLHIASLHQDEHAESSEEEADDIVKSFY